MHWRPVFWVSLTFTPMFSLMFAPMFSLQHSNVRWRAAAFGRSQVSSLIGWVIDSKVADQWWMWAGIASTARSSRAWARMQTARRRKLKCKNWGSKTMMMMSNRAVFDRRESERNAGRRAAGGNDSDGFETMPAAVEQWLISKLRCPTGRWMRGVWKGERTS